MDSNMHPLPGHEHASSCRAEWDMDLHIEDQTVTVVMPIVSFQPVGTDDPASPAQQAADVAAEQTALPALTFPRQIRQIPQLVVADPPSADSGHRIELPPTLNIALPPPSTPPPMPPLPDL